MENLKNQLLDAHHLVGPVLELQRSAYPVNCPVMFNCFTSADLDNALRKFWELEAIGMNNDNNEVYTLAEKYVMAKVAAS